jgi:dihydrofolate reductase
VAAIAANRVIGNRGALPWRLRDDMARFKRLTMGHAIIMGRATWDSIGRPLPGRRSIVLTRNPRLHLSGCVTALTPEQALALAGEGEAFVIGGAAVYAQYLPIADRMYVTWIDAAVEGDTVFPPVRWEEWRAAPETVCPIDPANPLPHRFVDYERIRE